MNSSEQRVPSQPQLIYVGDPMCSWCWGIAPTIERLAGRDDITVRVVVGGLRPGPSAQPLDDGLRRFLAHHWAKVAKATGQPCNVAGLAREGWVYDTELPAIAVTTMRHLVPLETLPFFTRLQEAFYRDAVDITDVHAYPSLLNGFAVDRDGFLAAMTSDEGRARAWEDFATARELGVAGFPTVLLEVDNTTQVLSRGYAPLDHFENQLTYWVEGKQPGTASTYTCSPDGSVC